MNEIREREGGRENRVGRIQISKTNNPNIHSIDTNGGTGIGSIFCLYSLISVLL